MPRYSEETKAKAIEMVGSGLSCKEVGRRLGISGVTIGQWANPELRERARLRTKEWAQQNPELKRQFVKCWIESNIDRVKENRKLYEEENKEKIKAYRADYHAKNREKRNADSEAYRLRNADKMRELWHDYAINNPDKNAAKSARRRAKEASVPQPSSTIEKMMIDNYYKEARRLTLETGQSYHVDHIWPISKGGPHLPWNLRVILGRDNCSKGAKIGDNWINNKEFGSL